MTPVVTVRWQKNGQTLISNERISLEDDVERVSSGVYEQTLIFYSPTLEDEGNYSCDCNIEVRTNSFQSQISGNPSFYALTFESEFNLSLLAS